MLHLQLDTKILFLIIISGLVFLSVGNHASAAADSIILTPFDISFSEKDFTKTGPSHHQILIIKPNQSATIPVKVTNNDKIQQEISFSVLTVNLGGLPFSYSFEPPIVSIEPNSEKEVLMHIQTGNTDQTTWGIIPVLAESKTFGAKGKSFYLVIGSNVTASDMEFIDVSLREGLPGPAFPYLYNDFRTKPPELQKVLDTITTNKFGTPRYLPQGYEFQGLSDPVTHSIFVYAPTKVTNTTESIDFLRSGGMIILYQVNNLNFDLTTWMPNIIAQDEGQQVMINGLIGMATEQKERVTTEGYKYKFPATVTFFQKSAQVYLSANMPLDELLKVAVSIPVPEVNNSPIIITQVELWGPFSFIAENVNLCDREGTSIGPWAVGWIQLYNTKNQTITTGDIELSITRGGTWGFTGPFTFGPNEHCLIQTEDQISTRIGPGGSEGNGPPNGYDGSAVILDYSVKTDKGIVRYQDLTPEFGDTYGDTRTWQFVDGKWVFNEGTIDTNRMILTKTTEDELIMVNMSMAKTITPNSTTFGFSFLDPTTKKFLKDVRYDLTINGGGYKNYAFANIVENGSERNLSRNGYDFVPLQSVEAGTLIIDLNITSVGDKIYDMPQNIEFSAIVVPEFPLASIILVASITIVLITTRTKWNQN
ncbi:MAG: hypothetical protein ACRD9Q_00660 [Nitrososphaeraceae archaeon]